MLSLLTGLALAGAPAEPLQLQWEAPEECPSAEDVSGRVLAAIGDTQSEVLEAEGTIARAEDGQWILTLTLAGSGTRRLDAGSCEELADAAVLILAIAIDPEAAERIAANAKAEPETVPEPEPKSASASASKSASASEPASASESEPRTSASPRVHIDAQISAGAAFGLLPDPGGWVAAGIGVWGRWWRAEIEGSYTTPSEQAAPDDADVRGRMQLWAIALRGGPAIPAGDVSFPITIGFEAGGMYGAGKGTGIASPNGSTAPWVGFIGGAAALWRPSAVNGRIAVGLRAEGIASITRPKFGTEETPTIYETRAGGARVAVIFAVRLR